MGLEMIGFDRLSDRWLARCLDFSVNEHWRASGEGMRAGQGKGGQEAGRKEVMR